MQRPRSNGAYFRVTPPTLQLQGNTPHGFQALQCLQNAPNNMNLSSTRCNTYYTTLLQKHVDKLRHSNDLTRDDVHLHSVMCALLFLCQHGHASCVHKCSSRFIIGLHHLSVGIPWQQRSSMVTMVDDLSRVHGDYGVHCEDCLIYLSGQ